MFHNGIEEAVSGSCGILTMAVQEWTHVITTCFLVLVTGLELMVLVLVKLSIAMVMRSLSFILLIGWCRLINDYNFYILVLYISHGREWAGYNVVNYQKTGHH